MKIIFKKLWMSPTTGQVDLVAARFSHPDCGGRIGLSGCPEVNLVVGLLRAARSHGLDVDTVDGGTQADLDHGQRCPGKHRRLGLVRVRPT